MDYYPQPGLEIDMHSISQTAKHLLDSKKENPMKSNPLDMKKPKGVPSEDYEDLYNPPSFFPSELTTKPDIYSSSKSYQHTTQQPHEEEEDILQQEEDNIAEASGASSYGGILEQDDNRDYYNLDEANLPRCLRYLSLFPQDYEFDKDDMVQLWMAEGFINSPVDETNMQTEDIGSACFDAFLSESVFRYSRLDSSIGRPRYKLNSFALDDIRNEPNDECCRIEDCMSMNISENTRHVSLCDGIEPTTFKDLYQSVKLCTLLLLNHRRSHIDQVPRDLFLKLQFRVLDLSYTNIAELPSSIGILTELRYLNLSETPITSLPESLCDLYNLQTLKLKHCVELIDLPKDLCELHNLRHLDLDVARLLVSMPLDIGWLTALQTLPAFVVGKEDGCHITELKYINNLRGALRIYRLENLSHLREALESALVEKKHIVKLELQWSELQSGIDQVLEDLQPHVNLNELKIVGYGGTGFPSWIGNPLYSNLVTIVLQDCRLCELLPPLGKLPLLMNFFVNDADAVKRIDSEFCGRNVDPLRADLGRRVLKTVSHKLRKPEMFKGFPWLKNMTINGMPSLEKWSGIKDGDFFFLQKLNISGCFKLTALPKLSFLKSLIQLEISHFPLLKCIPSKGLPTSLDSLIIIDCPLLKERCQRGGKDWGKIAHVPNIWIDYNQISE